MGVLLHDPTVKFKCTLGDRSFTAAAPKIWNGLADYIKKENDFDQFKRTHQDVLFERGLYSGADVCRFGAGLFTSC